MKTMKVELSRLKKIWSDIRPIFEEQAKRDAEEHARNGGLLKAIDLSDLENYSRYNDFDLAIIKYFMDHTTRIEQVYLTEVMYFSRNGLPKNPVKYNFKNLDIERLERDAYFHPHNYFPLIEKSAGLVVRWIDSGFEKLKE